MGSMLTFDADGDLSLNLTSKDPAQEPVGTTSNPMRCMDKEQTGTCFVDVLEESRQVSFVLQRVPLLENSKNVPFIVVIYISQVLLDVGVCLQVRRLNNYEWWQTNDLL